MDIKVSNLKKSYSGVTVLDIETLHIPEGQVFGLAGNNGAGKTTLFRLILDLIKADTGSVESNGSNVATTENWKSFTGSFLDEGFLIDYLTPEEYFSFVGKLNKLNNNEIKDFLEGFKDFFNEEILGKKKYIRDLSKGNQKKVGIAAAMMVKPSILILDEPFSNLDPSTQILLKQFIKKIKEESKVTVLISSHDLNHIAEVCDRIVILHKGKIVRDINTDSETLKDLEFYFASQLSQAEKSL